MTTIRRIRFRAGAARWECDVFSFSSLVDDCRERERKGAPSAAAADAANEQVDKTHTRTSRRRKWKKSRSKLVSGNGQSVGNVMVASSASLPCARQQRVSTIGRNDRADERKRRVRQFWQARRQVNFPRGVSALCIARIYYSTDSPPTPMIFHLFRLNCCCCCCCCCRRRHTTCCHTSPFLISVFCLSAAFVVYCPHCLQDVTSPLFTFLFGLSALLTDWLSEWVSEWVSECGAAQRDRVAFKLNLLRMTVANKQTK